MWSLSILEVEPAARSDHAETSPPCAAVPGSRDLQMPTDRVDVSTLSLGPPPAAFLTICSGVCLFPFMKVTSSPVRAIVTPTTGWITFRGSGHAAQPLRVETVEAVILSPAPWSANSKRDCLLRRVYVATVSAGRTRAEGSTEHAQLRRGENHSDDHCARRRNARGRDI